MTREFGSPKWHFDKIHEELFEIQTAKNEEERRKEYGDLVLAVFRYGEIMGYRSEEQLELSFLKMNSRMRVAKDMMALNPNLTIKQAYKKVKDMEIK